MKLRNFKGSRDYLPNEMRYRYSIINKLRDVFEQFGFNPVETPAIEYLDTLLGKYGEDAEKLIYRLAYKGGNEAALRYDLTMPLVRLMNQHRATLNLPFKRYQIQPVWRADSPQPNQGRYREFYQCDVDIIGSRSMIADTEIVCLLYKAFQGLDVGQFVFRINHRKVLKSLLHYFSIAQEDEMRFYRSIDKLDKISKEQVEEELIQKGFQKKLIHEILDLFTQPNASIEDKLSSFRTRFQDDSDILNSIKELSLFFDRLVNLGIPKESLCFDLSLVRGLDYYTGLIYEVNSLDLKHIGSLGGGGRYDGLIGSVSSSTAYPAVGATIGLDRVMTLINQRNAGTTGQIVLTHVLIALFNDDESLLQESFLLASELRNADLNVNMMSDTVSLNKQFRYADKNNIPLVVLIGPDEYERRQVTVKNLILHEQHVIDRKNLIKFIKTTIQK